MKGIIRKGDKLSSGGYVTTGSETMKFEDIGVAHKDDPVDCPLEGHNPSFIAEGHPTFLDNGRQVAFNNYRCTCGCLLISSLGNATASQ
ncbi:MAG: PAAR domain-containing protein [Yokenella regensburgei]|jgi:uncharacterized Zn-binding protein involved in type VI secretion|nr:PAAR domain-containing protein [Yokenella regensburgei]